jgi:hypothetical protein
MRVSGTSGEALSLAHEAVLAYACRATPAGSTADFCRLVGARGPLGWFSAACFLLYRAPDPAAPSVHGFLFRTAPLLLPRLSRSTERQRVDSRGHIRGRIDWCGTHKARLIREADPGAFVCLHSRRDFDRPENQLFKYLIEHVHLALDRIPTALGGWLACGQALRGVKGPPRLGACFAGLAHQMRRLRGHVHLSGVSVPAAIAPEHTRAARSAKTWLYSAVADLYDFYQVVVALPDRQRWGEILDQTLPLPPGSDVRGSRPR